MIAACYAMDVYCDNNHDQDFEVSFPHQFTGQTFGECKRQAIRRGWKFTKDDKHYCPKCSRKGKRP